MKPCATSARLLFSARCAMSHCALAEAAFWSACCTRKSTSSVSSWPIVCPAVTVSPSRTVSVFSSAATLARTTALSTAFRLPEICSVRLNGCTRANTMSLALSSIACAGFAGAAASACAWDRACSVRATKPATSNNTTNPTTHPNFRRFIISFQSCKSSAFGDGARGVGRAVEYRWIGIPRSDNEVSTHLGATDDYRRHQGAAQAESPACSRWTAFRFTNCCWSPFC